MCVSQFRDYVNCSKFSVDERGSYKKDLKNPDIETGVYIDRGKYQVYYKTDLKKMSGLVGNPYAKEHLNGK